MSARAFALPAMGALGFGPKRFVRDQVVQPRLRATTGTYEHRVPRQKTSRAYLGSVLNIFPRAPKREYEEIHFSPPARSGSPASARFARPKTRLNTLVLLTTKSKDITLGNKSKKLTEEQ